MATVALKIVQKIAALMTNVAPRLSKYSSNRIILVEAGELGPELSYKNSWKYRVSCSQLVNASAGEMIEQVKNKSGILAPQL